MTALTLDAPGTACAFESHGCSRLVIGVGGFDLHHPIPVECGGDERQARVPVCPIHHRRQHALIRYLIECHLAGSEPQWEVLRRFTAAERPVARTAAEHWATSGLPVPPWNVPAARAA